MRGVVELPEDETAEPVGELDRDSAISVQAYCVRDERGDQDAVIRYRLRVNVLWTPPVEQISQPKSIWFRPLPAGI